MKHLLFFIFFFAFFTGVNAKDTVIVHKDPRLDIISARQAAVNKLTAKMTSNGQYRGYRIQVMNTRSREDAFKLKSELMQMFTSQKTYVLYQSPYFKVRIGDFPEKDDAVSFRTTLLKKYLKSVYVVEDIIDYVPREPEDPVLN